MKTETDRTEPFPVEWHAWRARWEAWRDEMTQARILRPSSYRFPPKNFLADEIIGVWSINGRPVELSEVTFPDLTGKRRGQRARYIGVTFGKGSGDETGGLASTFAELERALGIAECVHVNCTYRADSVEHGPLCPLAGVAS